MAEIPAEWLHGETLGPRDVSRIFNVDARTVTEWARHGVIGFFRTPSGMRRFPECEVKRLMAGDPAPSFLREYAEEDTKRYKEKWRGGWRRGIEVTKVEDGEE